MDNQKFKESKINNQEISESSSERENRAKFTSKNNSVGISNDNAKSFGNGENEKSEYEVFGVKFKVSGKSYYFDPCGKNFSIGDDVIVDTSRGIEIGKVAIANKNVPSTEVSLPLRKFIRFATKQDLKRLSEMQSTEENARKIWMEKIQNHKLDMALSDVECSFDNSKLIFYFTAEGRIDFREFVKDLASVFKMRIELRQIGVRDEAKKLGGLGICGRPLCCNLFLDDFQQVSIKMAKEQNLSLNSAKISGTCGRLMCCLRYENDVYEEASKKCPKLDNYVQTPDGNGVVCEVNVLAGKCKVLLDSLPDAPSEYQASDIRFISKKKDKSKEENADTK